MPTLNEQHILIIQEELRARGFLNKEPDGIWCLETGKAYTGYAIRNNVDPHQADCQPHYAESVPGEIGDILAGVEIVDKPQEEAVEPEASVVPVPEAPQPVVVVEPTVEVETVVIDRQPEEQAVAPVEQPAEQVVEQPAEPVVVEAVAPVVEQAPVDTPAVEEQTDVTDSALATEAAATETSAPTSSFLKKGGKKK